MQSIQPRLPQAVGGTGFERAGVEAVEHVHRVVDATEFDLGRGEPEAGDLALRIVSAELRSELYYNRAAWQLNALHIR